MTAKLGNKDQNCFICLYQNSSAVVNCLYFR